MSLLRSSVHRYDVTLRLAPQAKLFRPVRGSTNDCDSHPVTRKLLNFDPSGVADLRMTIPYHRLRGQFVLTARGRGCS